MKNKAKKKKKNQHWLVTLLLSILFIDIFYQMKKKGTVKQIKHNFKDFLQQEEKEVEQLSHGQESFKRYCSDSCSIFKDYFIPHLGNDFKPKILRTKSLTIIAVALERLSEDTESRQVRTELPDGLPPISVDFDLIVQTLVNILDNAFKYSSRDSTVEINSRQVGQEIEISVADRGLGIPSKT